MWSKKVLSFRRNHTKKKLWGAYNRKIVMTIFFLVFCTCQVLVFVNIFVEIYSTVLWKKNYSSRKKILLSNYAMRDSHEFLYILSLAGISNLRATCLFALSGGMLWQTVCYFVLFTLCLWLMNFVLYEINQEGWW